MKFVIKAKDKQTRARTGIIKTLHGNLETPVFAPDATYGTVKHLSPEDLKNIPLPIILGNIYHLSLRPGIPFIKKMRGLHRFMNWERPIITDSGGFQVFSLVHKNKMGKILNHGVEFRDHVSGAKHLLTPEKCIEYQLVTGSDILMVLDYPIAPDIKSSDGDNLKSIELTTAWAKKCRKYFDHQRITKGKILMAIIQGAGSLEMRKRSYEELKDLNFDGYGFGGLVADMDILDFTARLIPQEKIRYVMGGGTPTDIVKCVAMGWDFFDCVIPTRNARHGLLYTFNGEIKILKKKYQSDKKVIEKGCPCLACSKNYNRAYLHHLFKVKEPLAARLATLHNLTFYNKLMIVIRENIEKGDFKSFSGKFLKRYRKN